MDKLTDSERRRVMDAIADCTRFIERESLRDPRLRPADMQRHLDFCLAHREKLAAMLVGSK